MSFSDPLHTLVTLLNASKEQPLCHAFMVWGRGLVLGEKEGEILDRSKMSNACAGPGRSSPSEPPPEVPLGVPQGTPRMPREGYLGIYGNPRVSQ